MPVNTSAQSLGAAFGLLLTVIVLWYLESTTSAFIWSVIYGGGIVVVSMAMCAKLSIAIGSESKFAETSDRIASVVPWVCLWFNGNQALHLLRDGADGMVAGLAVTALTVTVYFGLADSVLSLLGKKYVEAQEAMGEASTRLKAMNEAMHGQQSSRN